VTLVGSVWANNPESYIKLRVDDRTELESLTRVVSIDRVDGNEVWAYAWPDQLHRLEELGYSWQELPIPSSTSKARMGLLPRAASGDWDAYPTYAEYLTMMQNLANDFPDLCRLVEIGDSANQVRPHKLLALKITDNPDLEEDEPEVLYTSTMHGDETVGFVLTLRLAHELLDRYDPASNDPYDREITTLVNELEIWINPLANPDGTYYASDSDVSGALRNFTNIDGSPANVNPNRNFPDPDDGDHPDGNQWWPETVAMMAFAEQHSFVLSANFHGGIEVVNYPWDTWSRLHTDDRWFYALSRAYADRAQAAAASDPYFDNTYMRALDDGVTNGYQWYPVAGGRQDYMTYWRGSRETTIELSTVKNPPAAQLPRFWDYNRGSLLEYMAWALRGVRGVVTDGQGNPVRATVAVIGHDDPADNPYAVTDPDVGDYHRLLLPGRYHLVYSADGFLSDVATVGVLDGDAVREDIALDPDAGLKTSLYGTVTAALSGEPVVGAVVELLTPPGGSVVTDEDGTYLLPDLDEGAAILEISADGLATGVAATQARHPDSRLDVALGMSPIVRRPAGRR
jgi:hypothetical protein